MHRGHQDALQGVQQLLSSVPIANALMAAYTRVPPVVKAYDRLKTAALLPLKRRNAPIVEQPEQRACSDACLEGADSDNNTPPSTVTESADAAVEAVSCRAAQEECAVEMASVVRTQISTPEAW